MIFLNLIKDAKCIVKLKSGEQFIIGELQIDIFNAYAQDVIKCGGDDMPNQASFVVKITGERYSVLFCGGCHGQQMA